MWAVLTSARDRPLKPSSTWGHRRLVLIKPPACRPDDRVDDRLQVLGTELGVLPLLEGLLQEVADAEFERVRD